MESVEAAKQALEDERKSYETKIRAWETSSGPFGMTLLSYNCFTILNLTVFVANVGEHHAARQTSSRAEGGRVLIRLVCHRKHSYLFDLCFLNLCSLEREAQARKQLERPLSAIECVNTALAGHFQPAKGISVNETAIGKQCFVSYCPE